MVCHRAITQFSLPGPLCETKLLHAAREIINLLKRLSVLRPLHYNPQVSPVCMFRHQPARSGGAAVQVQPPDPLSCTDPRRNSAAALPRNVPVATRPCGFASHPLVHFFTHPKMSAHRHTRPHSRSLARSRRAEVVRCGPVETGASGCEGVQDGSKRSRFVTGGPFRRWTGPKRRKRPWNDRSTTRNGPPPPRCRA